MNENEQHNSLCDRILVVLGYHSDELGWGKIVEKQFKERGLDKDRNISFYTIEDSPVPTGYESPYSERKIHEEIERLGDVGLLVDMHCHPFLGLGREYFTDDHEPHFYTKNDELRERFRKVFPNTIASSDSCRKTNTAYAIFDPDFFGHSSMTATEVYEKGASETVENLDKLCMVFEGKKSEEIKSKYVKTIPAEDLDFAIKWCEQKIAEDSSKDRQFPYYSLSEDKRYFQFQKCLEDLRKGNIRYSNKDHGGVHIQTITQFANAYREKGQTADFKNNSFILGSNVDEAAFLMQLDNYLKNYKKKK